ncbi:MnhB domain-containing protein [Jiangella ureilytica]|uniref:MnhB domain-containing protein n=1 Tax=Jiangella ureilytica TaxID=2530374 RepID=UPI00193E2C2F|nr:MnhB domain-containing protein [Jiangella ureilytica]
MAQRSRKKKEVVRVESAPKARADAASGGGSDAPDEPTWTPTPEARKQATRLRLFAAGLWALAIAGEAFAIFWVLRQDPVAMVLLIVMIVVIGALAIGGSLLWKKANRLDPASRKDTVRFFVQNQLGAIITVIAFLPLIVLILTNKDMDGKQKGIAGGVAVVVLGIAAWFGMDLDAPSTEQYAEETNIVEQLTGENLVYWTRSGSVFHVCADVPDVNRESQDGRIYEGTVADAHAAGKSRLVSYWQREALNYCGYTQEQIDAVEAGTAPAEDIPTEDAADETAPADATATP